MFLWVFVAALVFSHLANFYNSKVVGFDRFNIELRELKQWLGELDPSTTFSSGGGNGGGNSDGWESELDYSFSMDVANEAEALKHLRECIAIKTKKEGWKRIHTFAGPTSFEFGLAKRSTRFRIYAWSLPVPADSQSDALKSKSKVRIKLLQVGYKFR